MTSKCVEESATGWLLGRFIPTAVGKWNCMPGCVTEELGGNTPN